MDPRIRLALRLMRHADAPHDHSCWEWKGYRNPESGYGQITLSPAVAVLVGGQRINSAPRVMCWLAHGPAGPKQLVMHRCDNPPCINPKHLSWGSYAENRHTKKVTIDPAKRTYGMAHPNVKYPSAIVEEAKRRKEQGETVAAISRALEVPYHTVRAWTVRGGRPHG